MKWQAVPLETVAEIQLGKMLSGKASKGVSPAPYLRNANVQWGRLMLDDLLEMDFSQTEREKFSLKQGDLIVCEGGEPGRCAVVTEPLQNIFFQKALMRVRPRTDRLTPKFLQRFMQHAASRGVFRQGGNQSTIAHFPAVRLRALAVPLPPLPEQKRIAAILDAADALRAKRRESIEQLDSLVQATFLEMFGDTSNEWELATVDQLAAATPSSIRTGPFGSQLLHSEFTDEGVCVLGIDNAVANEFREGAPRFISPAKYEELRRYTVIPGDVLITIMGTCGRCAIVPDGIGTAINTKHLCCITLQKTRCLPRFLHAYFLRHPVAQHHLRSQTKGAIMEGLNMGIIKKMPVSLPPLDLQTRFASIVESIEQQKARLKAHLAELDTLFVSLQSRAFNGELVA
jgi:type I restriction enzyme S subunit